MNLFPLKKLKMTQKKANMWNFEKTKKNEIDLKKKRKKHIQTKNFFLLSTKQKFFLQK